MHEAGRVAEAVSGSVRANDPHWSFCAGRAVLRGGGARHGVFFCPQVADGLRRAVVQGQHRGIDICAVV